MWSSKRRQLDIARKYPISPVESLAETPVGASLPSHVLGGDSGAPGVDDLSFVTSDCETEFFRISRLPAQEFDNHVSRLSAAASFLIACHGLYAPLLTRFEQRGGEIHLHLGLLGPAAARLSLMPALERLVLGHFPGSEIARDAAPIPSPRLAFASALLGVPARPDLAVKPAQDLGLLDAAVPDCDFGLCYFSAPLSDAVAGHAASEAARTLDAWYPSMRETQTLSSQAGPLANRSVQREITDRSAAKAVEWMENRVGDLYESAATGLWRWFGVLWSAEADRLPVLNRIAVSLFAGPSGVPEIFRTCPLRNDAWRPFSEGRAFPMLGTTAAGTLVSSRTLANLWRFPVKSYHGLQTTPVAEFAAGPRETKGPVLRLGDVVHQGAKSNRPLTVSYGHLATHTLIAGVTGSGKTNTAMQLLRELDRDGIPFLVLEPAKTEYRRLCTDKQFSGRLRVYTLGDETRSPFRLNPFAFPHGFSLSTHLDLLKAAFFASFSMYGPMPHVLEESLIRVYEKKGWDLASGTNPHLPVVGRKFLFPTLADLVREIPHVVTAAGYGDEVSMNIQGALRTRIRSLLAGAKGLMLGGAGSIDLSALFTQPAVLELQALGDDEEKAFLMGLLLVRLHEHRMVAGESDGKLVHVTLIEEAHRVLKKVPVTLAGSEVANPAGKAVDMFNNLLSEIRAYGEGLILAEQIPSKLSPDAIKNTGLKIVHRIYAADDRALLAGSMVLSEEQSRYLARLPVGTGILFGGAVEEAVAFSAPLAKPSPVPISDHGLSSRAQGLDNDSESSLERYPACFDCTSKCHRAREAQALDAEQHPDLYRHASRMILAWSLPDNLHPAPMSALSCDSHTDYCIKAHLAHRFVVDRAEFCRLSPADVVLLEQTLVRCLTAARPEFETVLQDFLKSWRTVLVGEWDRRSHSCGDCPLGFCVGAEVDTLLPVRNNLERIMHDVDPKRPMEGLRGVVYESLFTTEPRCSRAVATCVVQRFMSGKRREESKRAIWEDPK